jgi:hypothetical protein
MKNIMIFLLFVSSAMAQKLPPIPTTKPEPLVIATWKQEPIGHWSCPSGMMPVEDIRTAIAPHCHKPIPVPGGLRFNPDTQEYVAFEKEIILHKGLARIEWDSMFVKEPGCSITGDKKLHIKIVEESKTKMVINGRSGQRIHLSCYGVVQRQAESEIH